MARKKRRILTAGTKVVGYLPVSTEKPHRSLKARRGELVIWCEHNGAELVAVYTDQGSSSDTPLDKRAALLDALAAVQALGRHGLLVMCL